MADDPTPEHRRILKRLSALRDQLAANKKRREQLLESRRDSYREAEEAGIPVGVVAKAAGVSTPAVLQQQTKAREAAR